MPLNFDRVIWAAVILICAVWVCLVTLVFWNMDPKFGGPYRWSTFKSQDYWIWAWLPSIHFALLAYAVRFRWRRMKAGALGYQRYSSMFGPAVFILFAATYLLWGHGGLYFDQFDVFWRRRSDAVVLLLFFYAIYLALFLHVPWKIWVTAILTFWIVAHATGFLVDWLTYTTVTPVENGTRYSIIRPIWAEPLGNGLGLFASLFAIAAFAQLVINLVFASLFRAFGMQRYVSTPQ